MPIRERFASALIVDPGKADKAVGNGSTALGRCHCTDERKACWILGVNDAGPAFVSPMAHIVPPVSAIGSAVAVATVARHNAATNATREVVRDILLGRPFLSVSNARTAAAGSAKSNDNCTARRMASPPLLSPRLRSSSTGAEHQSGQTTAEEDETGGLGCRALRTRSGLGRCAPEPGFRIPTAPNGPWPSLGRRFDTARSGFLANQYAENVLLTGEHERRRQHHRLPTDWWSW